MRATPVRVDCGGLRKVPGLGRVACCATIDCMGATARLPRFLSGMCGEASAVVGKGALVPCFIVVATMGPTKTLSEMSGVTFCTKFTGACVGCADAGGVCPNNATETFSTVRSLSKLLILWWPGMESNRRRQPFQGCPSMTYRWSSQKTRDLHDNDLDSIWTPWAFWTPRGSTKGLTSRPLWRRSCSYARGRNPLFNVVSRIWRQHRLSYIGWVPSPPPGSRDGSASRRTGCGTVRR